METYDLLQSYAQATEIPIHIFSERELLHRFCREFQMDALPLYLADSLPETLPPAWHAYTPEHAYFGGITERKTENLILVGPVFALEVSLSQAMKLMERLEIVKTRTEKDKFINSLRMYPICNVKQLQHHLRFLEMLINGETGKETALVPFRWNQPMELDESLYELSLEEDDELQGKFEQLIRAMIRYGKTEEIASFINEQIFSMDQHEIPELSLQKKYMLGSNMLLSRTAMDAGVESRLVNRIVEKFIFRIERACTPGDLAEAFFQSAQTYARLVADLNRQAANTPIVRHVSAYIQSHLYGKLTTSAIAKGLGYAPTYLGAEFKKATGRNLTDYIQECKIQEARYLLARGDRSVAEISSLLSFSSPSYFCSVYKKVTGETPGATRHSNGGTY